MLYAHRAQPNLPILKSWHYAPNPGFIVRLSTKTREYERACRVPRRLRSAFFAPCPAQLTPLRRKFYFGHHFVLR
jgi:hypothetical protein